MRRTSLLLLAGLALGLVACRTAPTKPDTGPTDDCTWYTDLDGDGWGTDLDPQVGPCEGVGEGWVAEAGDCDDSDAALHPGATETCDGRDQDCDGDVDEEAADAATWYADADADGYGDSAGATIACVAPDGFIADGSDCDDTDAGVHPGATERCNGRDDDCDGAIDEDVQEVWYADVDGDGYGNPGAAVEDCDPGTGWVGDATDCDDQDAGVHPGAEETCDDRDEDCDGEVDEGLGQIWYADGDGDGYGDEATSIEACDPGPGWVEDDDDCDDANSVIHPGATERCDGLDDDCDSLVDDDDPDLIDAGTWYTDADGDGYGDGGATQACLQPAGTAAFGGDCDDMDPAYNPGAPETDCADPNDYNCDGYTGYSDADGDGFAACEDCDDGDASIFPGADEVCDGVDDDCDGAVDEADAVDAGTWYADGDGDGYGDTSSALVSCIMPTGYVADDTDCDDGARTVHPGAPEVCDGVDQDCDGVIDDGVTSTFWADADGDGYGDPAATTEACIAPSGTVADDTDCDDGAAGVNPGAAEVCDGVDDDCDGLVDDADGSLSGAPTWYLDHDADGYGTSAYTATRCTAPSGYIAIDSDCDDLRAAVHPGAAEVCDGLDDDCDGLVDDDDPDVTGLATWYADSDGDGYGDAGTSAAACTAPTGYVAASTDCDDGDASVSPAATEVCGGGDEDCDGLVDDADPGVTGGATWYLDYDGDGWGDTRITTTACLQPSEYAASAGDCDDLEPDTFPGNTEVCDGIDNDCDSLVDDEDPDIADALSWYADADADGYGDATSGVTACDAPTGYVADDTDCDDTDASSHPSATERYDGADNDCDGDVDEDLWVGDGAEGDLTVYGTVDLSTLYSGSRLWADAERVQVAAISGDNLTVSRTPWGMASGDEVLLINLQGSDTAHAAVGTYEFATVDSVSGTDVVLAAAVAEVYGETDNSDLTDQIIILQRVPHYADVTVFAGGVLTTDAWDASAGGGVLAFRASGTVYIEDGGIIDVSALGYAGGDTGTCDNCDAFQGESYTGVGIGNAYGGPYNETIGGYAANGGGGGANVTGGGGNHAAGATYGDSWNYGGYTAPSAGGSYGVPSLVTLFFGSGGGGVWNGGHDDPTEDPGPGGSGAGILYIGCGTLVAEGADALQAVGETTPYWAHGTWTYGAGGGAGGSVFLVAEEVDLATAAVNAEGGFGESTHLRVGGDGGYGRVRIDCNTCNGYAQGSGLASIALDDAAEPDPGYSSSPY